LLGVGLGRLSGITSDCHPLESVGRGHLDPVEELVGGCATRSTSVEQFARSLRKVPKFGRILRFLVVTVHAVDHGEPVDLEPGTWGRHVAALCSMVLLAAACGAPSGGRGGSGPLGPGIGPSLGDTEGDDGEPTAGEDADGDDDDGADDDAGDRFDVGSADDGNGIDEPEECAELVTDAMVGNQPADIIIAIDNSVSMANEIAGVQASMNAFSSQIAGAAVDPHVIMISGFEHNSDSGICVPPPLGSGLCPNADHNPPSYWRVDDWVGSHSALARVVSHYPDYMPALRPTAVTHVLVITDDDSDWTAQAFIDQFTALDPNFDDFVLHAIVNNSGDVYEQLAMQTGGQVASIASNDFQAIFDELANGVVATASLACEYEIPMLPPGQLFEADQVNVEFSDGVGGTLSIGWVSDAAGCGAVADGWYYDDPLAPTSIVLCPQTCDSIQGYEAASVHVIFGCATVPAG
jgi:hypothetical protein